MARIIRAKEQKNFTVLSNNVLQDPRLSWRASGILAYLLSLPPDAAINADALWTERKEGRDAVRGAVRELERTGYLVRDRWQTGSGRWTTDWVVQSKPELPGLRAKRGTLPKSLMEQPTRRLVPAGCG